MDALAVEAYDAVIFLLIQNACGSWYMGKRTSDYRLNLIEVGLSCASTNGKSWCGIFSFLSQRMIWTRIFGCSSWAGGSVSSRWLGSRRSRR